MFAASKCLSINEFFLPEVKDCEKNKHRHIFDIPSSIF